MQINITTGTIELNDTNWIDETRLVKWMYLNLSSDSEYGFEKRGSDLALNYKLSGQDLTDLLSYLNH